MTQKRLNSLSIVQENPTIVDQMSLIDVANDFVALHPSRRNIFGNKVYPTLPSAPEDSTAQKYRLQKISEIETFFLHD